jgi:hypothetical protein
MRAINHSADAGCGLPFPLLIAYHGASHCSALCKQMAATQCASADAATRFIKQTAAEK